MSRASEPARLCCTRWNAHSFRAANGYAITWAWVCCSRSCSMRSSLRSTPILQRLTPEAGCFLHQPRAAHEYPATEAATAAFAQDDGARECCESAAGNPTENTGNIRARRTRIRAPAEWRYRRFSRLGRNSTDVGCDDRRCNDGAGVLESQCGGIGARFDLAELSRFGPRPQIGNDVGVRTGNDRCGRAPCRCKDLPVI